MALELRRGRRGQSDFMEKGFFIGNLKRWKSFEHGLESLDLKETRPTSTFISKMILVGRLWLKKLGLLAHFCNRRRERPYKGRGFVKEKLEENRCGVHVVASQNESGFP